MFVSQSVKTELDNLVTLFSSKEFSEVCAHTLIRFPDVPMSKWSFSNRLIVAFHGSTDARGFRQWQAVKRHVKGAYQCPKCKSYFSNAQIAPEACLCLKCGERLRRTTIYILAPVYKKFQEIEKDDKDQEKQVEIVRLVGFTGVPVWRVEDTDGRPLVEFKPTRMPVLLDVAKKFGIDNQET